MPLSSLHRFGLELICLSRLLLLQAAGTDACVVAAAAAVDVLQSSLMGPSLTLPVAQGRFALGTWQGIYLNEHRWGVTND